ncbi:MAG: bifunctional UDP-N-acetylglucosamine diphosphorylase/glucosamine-1-phosphate N-acetyltransferase GlmU [Candidatus Lindowbacteria bacterium]|nr:bifunctional UDP-N-acetylglucosamine diphosphorylase/glucosamine-1-phosphate N-acetyltransferase GlmU [Candidatus Lindowbacteria bacterium]
MPAKKEKPVVCAILAAGQGTRMKSGTPKVLHKLCGKPMIDHIVQTAKKLEPARIYLIVGFREELVRQFFGDSVYYITQSQQLGTGHAVLQARDELFGYKGDVVVLYGDVPLVTEGTLRSLVARHRETGASATLVTTRVKNSTGFGRVIRNRSGRIAKIVEEKDASPAQKRIKEINPGIYCFEAPSLMGALTEIGPANKQQEYYLTDVVEVLVKKGKKVETITTSDEVEILQVNTRKHLAQVNRIMHERVLEKLMDEGVTIIDPRTTFVSETVKVEKDVTIYPFTYIEGYTHIGAGTIVGPQTYITDSVIGNNVVIVMSYISSSIIRDNSRVGPYSHLRPEAIIGESVHIGNFVEVKKSVIEENSKVNHLSYIGDAKIGKNVNVGAGTITANYDGVRKNETVIEDGASIGSGTVLIAPVRIGKKAVTGAGTVVPKCHDIPPNAVFAGVPARELKPNERNV